MGVNYNYCDICGEFDSTCNLETCYITRNGKVQYEGTICVDCYNNENELFEYTLDEDGELFIEIGDKELKLYMLMLVQV